MQADGLGMGTLKMSRVGNECSLESLLETVQAVGYTIFYAAQTRGNRLRTSLSNTFFSPGNSWCLAVEAYITLPRTIASG